MTIDTDIRSLNPGALVELFELDATSLGGTITRVHAGTNGLRSPVVWQGNTYTPFPVEASGFDYSGKGQLPRPTLRIANVTSAVGVLVRDYGDLQGAKVTRRRTLAKYLDAVNFPARRNLLINTEAIGAWSVSPAGCMAVDSDVILSPIGTQTADKLKTNDTASNGHTIFRTFTGAPSTQYVGSAYLKAGEYTRCSLMFGNTGFASINVGALFDLVSGTVVATLNGATATITKLPDGWYRCAVVATSDADGGTFTFQIAAKPSSTSNVAAAFTPTATGLGCYAWGAQVEVAADVSEYQPVGASFSQNPTADPTAQLPDEVYYIDRKATENKVVIEFELAAAFDVAGVQLPRRAVVQNVCPWKYRVADESSGCTYTGTSYFDASDNAVASAGQDVCGKRLTSCKLRHGIIPLPFGGFPGAGLTR